MWFQQVDTPSAATPPEAETAVLGGSGDLKNSDLSTGSQLFGQIVPPLCNGAKIESLPDVV